jgi:hypothetical protein
MTASSDYFDHPAFEELVELISWAASDDCDATFGEVAVLILRRVHEAERRERLESTPGIVRCRGSEA